ncbi:MAG: response regulator transcription factor [Rhodospirillales bacterium]
MRDVKSGRADRQDLEAVAGPMTAMRILIADDHWVVRESLKQVAKSLDKDNVVVEAASFNDALELLDEAPDIGLMLIDLIMPGFGEFEGLKLLRSNYPSIPIVVVSIHEDPQYVLNAIAHGVIGYIPKSASSQEIRRALVRVISGEVAFPREIIAQAVSPSSTIATSLETEPSQEGPATLLTKREREILVLLGRGTDLSEIAERLSISRQTVRVHIGNAMKKLRLTTREAVIRFALENVQSLSKTD